MRSKVSRHELDIAGHLELEIRKLRINYAAEVQRCDTGIKLIHSHVLGNHVKASDDECPVCVNT